MHIIIQIDVLQYNELTGISTASSSRNLLHDGFATSQKCLVEELKKKGLCRHTIIGQP